MTKQIEAQLEQIAGADHVIQDAPMSKYTSFRAGGKADLLVSVSSGENLQQVLQFLAGEDIPHMILGNGSNILVRDGGYRGVIVRIGEAFNRMRIEDHTLICGSGVSLAMAAKAAANASLTGLEFASGIPGSVGGGVFMNAGAYGGELKDILKKAVLITGDGAAFAEAGPEELEMGYRHTRLHETGEIVVEAAFELEPGDPKALLAWMADLTARRNEKQPVTYPSAGSFFKRPEGYFAGKLIQDAGLKGLSVGGAQVSQLHSGFIINTGGATATDILQLMQIVQARVLDQFGVLLEPEVRIIGE
ncbi:MAG: UDP-N-acetylmuramate dehydrogenase [Firmicutes bacterium]|nr:UDP-N-acetylmuramate dehydrogenase [Bacillota bacterium]